jgi:hypothetical protein
MSFCITFTARTIHSARQKLHEAYAPACVKALIEKALDAIREPSPANCATAEARQETAKQGAAISTAPRRQPEFCGVLVEAWGHIDDTGIDKSWIDCFVVQPLFD